MSLKASELLGACVLGLQGPQRRSADLVLKGSAVVMRSAGICCSFIPARAGVCTSRTDELASAFILEAFHPLNWPAQSPAAPPGLESSKGAAVTGPGGAGIHLVSPSDGRRQRRPERGSLLPGEPQDRA